MSATLSALQARASAFTALRRDIHQHPELGYAEKRTAALVSAHLKALGMEVQENVGGIPGVVGILKGGKPGPFDKGKRFFEIFPDHVP